MSIHYGPPPPFEKIGQRFQPEAPLGGDAVRQAWDVVERPEHYASLTPEPLAVIESWGLGYHEGNVLKYLARWRRKGGVQDLRKAAEYLRRLIELAERKDAPT